MREDTQDQETRTEIELKEIETRIERGRESEKENARGREEIEIKIDQEKGITRIREEVELEVETEGITEIGDPHHLQIRNQAEEIMKDQSTTIREIMKERTPMVIHTLTLIAIIVLTKDTKGRTKARIRTQI